MNELNAVIDEIQRRYNLPAAARNMLHAARPGHPLGKGVSKSDRIANVRLALAGRATNYDIERLVKQINLHAVDVAIEEINKNYTF